MALALNNLQKLITIKQKKPVILRNGKVHWMANSFFLLINTKIKSLGLG